MNTTTLNIRIDIYNCLQDISLKMNIPVSKLIIEIINLSVINLNSLRYRNGLIHYQEKQIEKNSWKCFRINFNEELLNKCINVRSNYRISLSKLIFIGFLLFMNKIIKKFAKRRNIKFFSNSYTSLVLLHKDSIKTELEIFNNIIKTNTT